MEPIIRFAQVSPVARRIGRPAPVGMDQACAAMAPLSQAVPFQPAPQEESDSAAASAQAAVADVAAVAVCACADELTRAGREHEAALAKRDAEIDALRKAAQQAAIELTDAYTDAERRGYAAGEEKGKQAAGDAMRAQTERIKSLAVDIGEALRGLLDTSEDAMVDIAFAAICRILGEQGATRDAVQGAVRAAVAGMREREQLVVRLHPDDAALLQDDGGGGVMRISADPAVVLGGCIVESQGGSLDARYETQLEALGAALKDVRASRLAGQGDA